MKWRRVWHILFLLIIGWQAHAAAQLSDLITLHGFGGWAYGTTDNANRYMMGNADGDYKTANFTLNISAAPYENVQIYTQTAYNESFNEAGVALDYAFAEWRFSDTLQLRAGKIKAPFMFYTEIYDVGTLRPFFMLPQGLYRDLAAEAYNGAGVTGSFLFGNYELLYDLYGGSLALQPNSAFDMQNQRFLTMEVDVRDLIGGRLTLRTPIEGLHASLSSYAGRTRFFFDGVETPDFPLADQEAFIGGSLEYTWKGVLLRGEYIADIATDPFDFGTGYVEAAYYVRKHWQLAVRYEHDKITLKSLDFAAMMPTSIFEHQDTAVGLNYWFNPSFVMKTAYHFVTGNRFAAPDNPQDYIQQITTNTFDDSTGLFEIGVQFSF